MGGTKERTRFLHPHFNSVEGKAVGQSILARIPEYVAVQKYYKIPGTP